MQEITREQEAELWQRYHEHNDNNARLQLIEHYLPLARRIATQLYKCRPDEVAEISDYYHFGILGLIAALERYSPQAKGEASFSTYAHYRIRGVILNNLDKLSEYREQLAFRRRAEKDRIASLHESSNVSSENSFLELAELTIGLAIGCLLEDTGALQDSDIIELEPLYNQYWLGEIKEQLNTIVEALPSRERMIIRYHYYYQVPFDDLAEILEISKGRVSQIHRAALITIRQSLADREKLDQSY